MASGDELTIRPISIHEANVYVEQYHRHHGQKTGCRFAVSCYRGGVLVGVAICSNPVARNSDDGTILEVSRLCTDVTKNACAKLYTACARIAKEMGFRRIQTFILESEPGTSLKASGWVCDGTAGYYSWLQTGSKREQERHECEQISLIEKKQVPKQMKIKWHKDFYNL